MFWPQHPGWVSILVYVSLFLNYLNLLPILPLDGGQLLELAIFQRKRILRLALKTLSFISFVLGAWLLSDPVFALLGLLFGYIYIMEVKRWLDLRKYQRIYDEKADSGDKPMNILLLYADD